MARLPYKSERNETREIQNRGDHKIQEPKNTKELKPLLGSIQYLFKFIKKPFQEDTRKGKSTEERYKMGIDTGD